METKLKELTQRLYDDGVKNGESKAQEIVKQAEEKKAKMIADAKFEAEQLILHAKKEAEALRNKTEAEIKLSSQQSINELKNQITHLISSAISTDIKTTLNDKEFFQKVILAVVEHWFKKSGEDFNMTMQISQEGGEELKKVLEQKCTEKLKQGLEYELKNKKGMGFSVSPKDNSFILDFSPESFAAFFEDYLRIATKELLFK